MTEATNGFHAPVDVTGGATGGATGESKAGRPLLNGDAPAQRITITITAEDLALLDEVSNGNRSEGVRLALRALRVQRVELKRIKARMEADPASIVSHEELQRRLTEKKAALHVLAP